MAVKTITAYHVLLKGMKTLENAYVTQEHLNINKNV